MITKAQRQQPDQTHLKLLHMSGDVHPIPGPATKYPCPVCTRNVTSRGVSYKCNRCSGWVHAKSSGLFNAEHYRRKSDWTCDTCSAPSSQQSPATTPSPPFPLLRLPNRSVTTARSTSYSPSSDEGNQEETIGDDTNIHRGPSHESNQEL